MALSKIYGGHKPPKSQKPSQFKGEISKNRKNPQNLNAFQKFFEFTGGTGGRGCTQRRPCRGFPNVPAPSHRFTQAPTGFGIFYWAPAASADSHRFLELSQVPTSSCRFPHIPTGSNGFPRVPVGSGSFPQISAASRRFPQLPSCSCFH